MGLGITETLCTIDDIASERRVGSVTPLSKTRVLKLNKVCLVVGDILPKLFRVVLSCKAVGVVSIGK